MRANLEMAIRWGVLAMFSAVMFSGCGGEETKVKPEKKGGDKVTETGGGEKPKKPVAPVDERKPTDGLSVAVEGFTGGHAKLVWSAHQNEKTADTYASGKAHLLVGLDTRDGKGVRTILGEKSNYARPMVTPGGEGIVYTFNDISRKGDVKHYEPTVWRVGWDGGGQEEIGEGYATDVWRDGEGRDWVYAVRDIDPSTRAQIAAKELVRFPLDAPGKVEVVWTRTKLSADNTQLSRNGKRASGLFPWPHVGVMDLEKGTWKRLELGCWPAHVPDDSEVSWVFDGGHRFVTMFRGAARWEVKMNGTPDLEGAEVYHPRWSNHPRYIAMTGPYRGAKTGHSITAGGVGAEVFLAKFNADLTAVEGYLRITDNGMGDFYPDLWIAGGDEVSLELPPVDAAEVVGGAWPGAGAVFGWKNLKSENEITAEGGVARSCQVEARGFARYGRFSDLLVDGGHFVPDGVSAAAVEGVIGGGAASFSVLFEAVEGAEDTLLMRVPGMVVQRGGAEGSLVVYRKAGDGAGYVRSVYPGVLPAGVAKHVVVSADGAGVVVVWVDGVAVEASVGDAVELPEAYAQPGVEFGGGPGGGRMEQVAVFGRAMVAEDVAALAAAAKEAVGGRGPAPVRLRLRGKLVESDLVPTWEAIQPYREGLMNVLYEVEEVMEGEYAGGQILVRHWGMMDEKAVPGWPREVGKSYELVVEGSAAHPELKGARVMDSAIFAPDLQVYYDVATPGK